MKILPTVEIPKNKEKIIKQIKALEWQINRDTNEIDIEIHKQALNDLKAELNRLNLL